jgi:hypothetical protein
VFRTKSANSLGFDGAVGALDQTAGNSVVISNGFLASLGGIIGATNAAVVDTLRVGKFLTDLPKGPLWIVKQVGLQ